MFPFADIRQTVNPRLKHTYIQVEPNGAILLKTPRRLNETELSRLLQQRANWIAKAQRRSALLHTNRLKEKDPVAYVWGEALPVRFENASVPSLQRHNGRFLLYRAPLFCPDSLQTLLDRLYEKEAKKHLPPKVEHYADIMRFYPSAVRFRKTKRQWGSCSAADRISLNTMLAKVPMELAEYVVVHELAHIRYKHHQKAFWDLVASVMPDYRKRRNELKYYTTH